MLSHLRKAVTPLKLGLAAPLAKAGIDPNWVTLAAIPFALGAMGAAATGHFWLALSLAIPAGLADFLDGAVAELLNRHTPQGNFLEACVDRVVDGFLLGGLVVRYPFLSVIAMTLSFTISYIKARVGLVIEADNSDWPGWGDRTDRLALTVLAYAGAAYSFQAGQGALALLVFICTVGSFQRMRHAFKLIKAAQANGTLLSYLK